MNVNCHEGDSLDKFTCEIGLLNAGQGIEFRFQGSSTTVIPASSLEAEFTAPGFLVRKSSRLLRPQILPFDLFYWHGHAELTSLNNQGNLKTTDSSGSITAFDGPTKFERPSLTTYSLSKPISIPASDRTPITLANGAGDVKEGSSDSECAIPTRMLSDGESDSAEKTDRANASTPITSDGLRIAEVSTVAHIDQTNASGIYYGSQGPNSKEMLLTQFLSDVPANPGPQLNGLTAQTTVAHNSGDSGGGNSQVDMEHSGSQNNTSGPPESLGVKVSNNSGAELSTSSAAITAPVPVTSTQQGCNAAVADAPMKIEVLKSGGGQLTVSGTAIGDTKNSIAGEDRASTCKQQ